MDHKKGKSARKIIVFGWVAVFLLGCVFSDEILWNHLHIFEDSVENDIDYEDLSPLRSPLSSGYAYLNPQIIWNESQLADVASAGDGESWETAFIIENWRIEQNITDFGLAIKNITQYVIIRNVYFSNLYSGYESSSLLIENVENLRVVDCNFRAYTRKNSPQGIRIESSKAITIQDVDIYDYDIGISLNNSFNCLINGSGFRNQKWMQLDLNDCRNISIENNRMACLNNEDSRIIYAINSRNISEFDIIGNDIDLLNQGIFLWESENISFLANQLPNTMLYEVCNLEIIGNEISKGLHINSARNVSIMQNTFQEENFQEGYTGITGLNMYQFIIEQNTFRDIKGAVFHFRYFSVAPYTTNEFWLETPTNTTEVIKGNTVFMAGSGLWRNLPPNIKTTRNLIIPHIGFLIVGIVLLYCLLSLLYGFFINKKKGVHIRRLAQQLQQQTQQQTQKQTQQDSLPHMNNFSLLVQTETMKFKQTSTLVLTLCGIYASLIYSEIYLNGFSAGSFLHFFLGSYYNTDYQLRTLLDTLFFIFAGIWLCYFTYQKFHKINRTPKILPSKRYIITRNEKIVGAGVAGTLIMLIITTICLVYCVNLISIALLIGILSGAFFILNVVLKLARKTESLWFELPLLGFIFIAGYSLIIASIDPSLISMSPLPEEYSTKNLLVWGFIIVGCIAELRLYLNVYDDKMKQGDIKVDESARETKNL